MKSNANEGLPKVYWTIVITAVVLLVLGAIMWWYDGYMLRLA